MPGPRPSVPNGSTQRFTWSTQWLHLSQRFFPGFPSKGKPQIPGKTSQQWRLKTYRDHTRTESFMKMTLITVMTSTGHSDASVCERLSSCAPGATATLDLGRPMHVLLSKHLKTPQKITKCNKFHEDKPYMKCIATRFKMIQRGCWMWVKILGVMFPFGASGAAACRMAALSTSCGGHIGYTCLSGFFPRFAKKQLLFCSLQTLSFSWWWKSFTTRGPILNPTKTESEFPSKGKMERLGKTSQQWRLKTYRDHTRTETGVSPKTPQKITKWQ